MYKKPNFTTLSDLSKIVKTHSKTELKRIAHRIDDLAVRPQDRRRLGVAEGTVLIYNEDDTELIDVAFHDYFPLPVNFGIVASPCALISLLRNTFLMVINIILRSKKKD